MANVTPPKTWQAPLRQLSVTIIAHVGDETRWKATMKTADKGDAKAKEAVLGEGVWPKRVESRQDVVRALRALTVELLAAFDPPE